MRRTVRDATGELSCGYSSRGDILATSVQIGKRIIADQARRLDDAYDGDRTLAPTLRARK